MVLSEEDYYKRVEDSKKKAIDMEAELMKYISQVKATMPQPPVEG